MSEYNPDVWVVVELSGTKVPKTYHRILSGNYGGYAGSDTWKLNSGIEKIVDCGDHYKVHGTSGSIYECGKVVERFSNYTSSIFSTLAEQNSDEITIKQVPMASILDLYLA